ncbi:MAG: hypothetical protein CMP11_02390 [Zetaproteobacteria bacterium]|nr:hypothetical protein [Pseudobdellovibrionaceae bacterium]|tara:strand:- start:548 stop:1387 length:840 start_codon:yes stop_codon:yes gene_type:complete
MLFRTKSKASGKKIFLFVFFYSFLLNSCHSIQIKTDEDIKLEKLLETQLLLAQNYIDNKKPENALEILKPLDDKFKDTPNYLNILGLTHLSIENPDQAMVYFRRAYRIKNDTAIGLNYSSALIHKKQYKKARKILFKLKKDKTYKKKERLYHNIALTYQYEEQIKKAILYYKKATTENPSYFMSYLQLAIIAKNLNKIKKSEEYYKKANQFCSLCFEPIEKLAEIYKSQRQENKRSRLVSSYLEQKNISDNDRKSANILLRKPKKQTSYTRKNRRINGK